MTSVAVIIPTFGRSTLLHRTLESLSRCEIPENLTSIIVVENGPKCDAESLVSEFQAKLPLAYHYVPKANKSFALNQVLLTKPADFLVFFDDDIRADSDILTVYACEVAKHSGGFFLGGKVEIDYEEPPPDWLKQYLPPSAVGWDLGPDKCPIGGPYAIGMNWGAFADDINKAGGFNPNFGPGTGARGQETTMQKDLIRVGVNGVFIPEAVVWHYVPKNRCSPEWALDRVTQLANRLGQEMRSASLLGRMRRLPFYYLQRQILRRSLNHKANLQEYKTFQKLYRLKRVDGLLHGYTRRSA